MRRNAIPFFGLLGKLHFLVYTSWGGSLTGLGPAGPPYLTAVVRVLELKWRPESGTVMGLGSNGVFRFWAYVGALLGWARTPTSYYGTLVGTQIAVWEFHGVAYSGTSTGPLFKNHGGVPMFWDLPGLPIHAQNRRAPLWSKVGRPITIQIRGAHESLKHVGPLGPRRAGPIKARNMLAH